MKPDDFDSLPHDEQTRLHDAGEKLMKKLVGGNFAFYGATENCFKIGDKVFDVVEDQMARGWED